MHTRARAHPHVVFHSISRETNDEDDDRTRSSTWRTYNNDPTHRRPFTRRPNTPVPAAECGSRVPSPPPPPSSSGTHASSARPVYVRWPRTGRRREEGGGGRIGYIINRCIIGVRARGVPCPSALKYVRSV